MDRFSEKTNRMPGLVRRDPIVALATAPGQGAIGVIRISDGFFFKENKQENQIPDLFIKLIEHILKRRELKPRYATFSPFYDLQTNYLDEGIVLFFPAPHSYTGESVLEFQGHGGTAVMRRLLEVCCEIGAPYGLRLARAGEFTERAFLNEKMDLLKAEAVADLIQAESVQAAKSAAKSLSGVFSELLHQLQETLIRLRLLVEATLDFPEEEIDFLKQQQAKERLIEVYNRLTVLISQSRQGALLQHGVSVVLVGSPNVGKSTLMNALAREDISIVSPIAGTTRDQLKQQIHLQGVPIKLVDTAGLRETADVVEQIGIERTWKEIEKADLILHLIDASLGGEKKSKEENLLLEQIKKRWLAANEEKVKVPVLRVHNKIDQLSSQHSFQTNGKDVWVSAQRGDGLDQLEQIILKQVGFDQGKETPLMARERHIFALQRANQHLETAQQLLEQGLALELLAEELRSAHHAIGEIVGEFTADDLLGEIFSRFCIGK